MPFFINTRNFRKNHDFDSSDTLKNNYELPAEDYVGGFSMQGN